MNTKYPTLSKQFKTKIFQFNMLPTFFIIHSNDIHSYLEMGTYVLIINDILLNSLHISYNFSLTRKRMTLRVVFQSNRNRLQSIINFSTEFEYIGSGSAII